MSLALFDLIVCQMEMHVLSKNYMGLALFGLNVCQPEMYFPGKGSVPGFFLSGGSFAPLPRGIWTWAG